MHPIEPVQITLDRPRQFLLDFRAMSMAEREIAKCWGVKRVSLIKLFQEGDVGLTDVACLLWAGFSREDPKLTVDQVLDLLAQTDVKELESTITAALERYVGVTRKDETKEGSPKAADPSGSATTSGSGSGASAATTSDSPTPSSGV